LRDDNEGNSRDDRTASEMERLLLEVVGRESNEDANHKTSHVDWGSHVVAVRMRGKEEGQKRS